MHPSTEQHIDTWCIAVDYILSSYGFDANNTPDFRRAMGMHLMDHSEKHPPSSDMGNIAMLRIEIEQKDELIAHYKKILED